MELPIWTLPIVLAFALTLIFAPEWPWFRRR